MALNKQIFKFWVKNLKITDLKVSCVFFFSIFRMVLEVAEMSRRVIESHDLLCGWVAY